MTVHRCPTLNPPPLSHVNNLGSPYSESRGIARKQDSQEFQTNLEILCTETRTLAKRVLPTVYEIHRTSRDSLNLVPNFFSPKHTRLDEFELQHQDVLTVALELHSEALLAVTGLLDRVLSVDVDFPRVRES
jgi:hypothetical protein